MKGLGILFGIICAVFGSVACAHAHSIDRQLCEAPPEKYAHLGLDDAEFCECFVQYWHCRRPLEDKVISYAWVVGQINMADTILGQPLYQAHPNIIGYFQTIDAEPITQHPGDLGFCKGQIEACEATTWIIDGHIDSVRQYSGELLSRIDAEFVRKPPKKKGKK